MAWLDSTPPSTAQEPRHPREDRPLFSVQTPARGMTMEQVVKNFGLPEQEHIPVGQPPITRWVYPQFTVYFEQQYVIQAVLAR